MKNCVVSCRIQKCKLPYGNDEYVFLFRRRWTSKGRRKDGVCHDLLPFVFVLCPSKWSFPKTVEKVSFLKFEIMWYCRVNVEMITPALKIWRDAVLTAQSAAQLSMCLSMLYDCVAWEKSIMKVVSVKRDVMFSMVTRQSPNAPSRSRFYGIIIG